MALFTVENVKISGLSACVPKQEKDNNAYDLLTEQERKLLIKTTGVEKRRIAEDGIATSDLCYNSAKALMKKLDWNPEEVGILIFVSQSPDYYLPASGIILQDRLGLPKTSLAFDMNLGCSGYIYGLSVVSSLMSTSKIKKGLLLVGDVSSISISEKDKSTYPLFGDAGTATAIEYSESAPSMFFNAQSDGSGHKAIIIPDGGLRNPLTDESFEEVEVEKGITRSKRSLHLEGLDVFNFSVTEVPPHVQELANYCKFDLEDFDYYVMHQANKLMNETIRKKLKIDEEKVPYSLAKYGNTSSASIPITMVSELKNALKDTSKKVLMSGFGVGLSWASLATTLDNVVCTEVLEYE